LFLTREVDLLHSNVSPTCFSFILLLLDALEFLPHCSYFHKLPFVSPIGEADGILFEDDIDGFGFKPGKHFLTTYEVQQLSSENGSNDGAEVIVQVTPSKGDWTRPDR
jgi:hypothetical protein